VYSFTDFRQAHVISDLVSVITQIVERVNSMFHDWFTII